MKVNDVFRNKNRQVYTITEDSSLSKAVALFMRHRVGALLVVREDGDIRGIISERDIMRHLDESGGVLGSCLVRETMTPHERLVVATEEDDLDYAMDIMTKNRIRHLPIIGESGLAGMLSIGDIIKSLLSSNQHQNKMLQDYIVGRYPA